METQPHEPCPRCDYPIHSTDVAICSECGLDLKEHCRPLPPRSLLFAPVALFCEPFEQVWERRQHLTIPIIALLTLLVSTVLATVGIAVEWYPAEIDHTGKFVWCGNVQSLLGHQTEFVYNGKINFEHGHAGLVQARRNIRAYPHSENALRNKTRLINPPAHYALSLPNAGRFWELYVYFAMPCLAMAFINYAFPSFFLHFDTRPEISRRYTRLMRRRIANLAWVSLFWQAVAVGVFSIYDLVMAPLLGTPGLYSRLLGFEFFGGMLIFQSVLIVALARDRSELFLPGWRTIQLAHIVVLTAATMLALMTVILGFEH